MTSGFREALNSSISLLFPVPASPQIVINVPLPSGGPINRRVQNSDFPAAPDNLRPQAGNPVRFRWEAFWTYKLIDLHRFSLSLYPYCLQRFK